VYGLLDRLSWCGSLVAAYQHLLLSFCPHLLPLSSARVDLPCGAFRRKAVAFSPDGSHVLASSQDNTIKVYALATQARVQLLAGHTDWVNSAQFHPADANRVVSCSDDRTIRAWDVAAGRQVARVMFESKTKATFGQTHDGFVWGACFSPDGALICTCSADHTARLWDAVSGEQLFQLTGHDDEVTSCHFNHDGRLVVTGSDDKSVRVWRTNTGEQWQKMTVQTKVTCVRVAHHSDRIALSHGSNVVILDIATAKECERFTHHSALVRCCDWSPADDRLLTGSNDKTASVFDVASQRVLTSYQNTEGRVVCCRWSQQQDVVATGGGDRKVRLWNAATGETLAVLEGHGSAIKCIDFSSDGTRLVSSSEDRSLRVWELIKKQVCMVFSVDDDVIIAFGMDACVGGCMLIALLAVVAVTLMLSNGWGMGITMRWRLAILRQVMILMCCDPVHPPLPGSSSSSSCSSRFQTICTIEGHSGYVTTCAFSADGTRIVSGSKDRSSSIWHSDRSSRLLTLRAKWSARLPSSRVMTMMCGSVVLSTFYFLELLHGTIAILWHSLAY